MRVAFPEIKITCWRSKDIENLIWRKMGFFTAVSLEVAVLIK